MDQGLCKVLFNRFLTKGYWQCYPMLATIFITLVVKSRRSARTWDWTPLPSLMMTQPFIHQAALGWKVRH